MEIFVTGTSLPYAEIKADFVWWLFGLRIGCKRRKTFQVGQGSQRWKKCLFKKSLPSLPLSKNFEKTKLLQGNPFSVCFYFWLPTTFFEKQSCREIGWNFFSMKEEVGERKWKKMGRGCKIDSWPGIFSVWISGGGKSFLQKKRRGWKAGHLFSLATSFSVKQIFSQKFQRKEKNVQRQKSFICIFW